MIRIVAALPHCFPDFVCWRVRLTVFMNRRTAMFHTKTATGLSISCAKGARIVNNDSFAAIASAEPMPIATPLPSEIDRPYRDKAAKPLIGDIFESGHRGLHLGCVSSGDLGVQALGRRAMKIVSCRYRKAEEQLADSLMR
jgi:hypothetical protein